MQSSYYLDASNGNYQSDIFYCNNIAECTNAIINCPTDADCTVKCTEHQACIGAVINCPQNGNCDITCSKNAFFDIPAGACAYSIINGPTDGISNLSILCYGGRASANCWHMEVHAESVGYLEYKSTGQYEAYGSLGVAIWFPPKTGEYVRASIKVNQQDFGGVYGYEPIEFYALNGWNDLYMDYTEIAESHGGVMYCNYNYTDSCLFWSNA